MMPPDGEQARGAAAWAIESSPQAVLALSDGSTYSNAMARTFVAAIGRRAAAEVYSFDGKVSAGDLSRRLREGRPGAIFYAPSTVGQALALADALASESYAGPVYSGDVALSDQLLEGAGPRLENWHIIYNGAAFAPATEQARAWVRDFTARTGKPPTKFAANAYDAASAVVQAAESGRAPNRQTVLRGLQEGREFVGLNGPFHFEAAGDRSGGELTPQAGDTLSHRRLPEKARLWAVA
jgi:ABC-type branched-subunit amino acid transport system substrate-binding protein